VRLGPQAPCRRHVKQDGPGQGFIKIIALLLQLEDRPQSPSPGSDGFVGKGHWKEGIGREVRIDQADSWPGGVRYPVEQ